MIRAYAEQYLSDAMQNLGEAFDYAVNACKVEMTEFMELFIASGYAEAFGNGAPKFVSGLSGTELVMSMLEKTGIRQTFPDPINGLDRSPEYWCGWILAYYQWHTGRTFKNIAEYLSMAELLKLYPTLHEAAEDKFVDTVNAIISRKCVSTRLQLQRKKCGYSQRVLAEKSGIKLRTIQQYEMRAKEINKAAVSTLIALAATLGCRIEDLLEYKVEDSEN